MSCTVFAGADERPLLASNSDNPYDTRTRVVVESVDGTQFVGTRVSSIAGSVEWDDMITRAVNEHGMAFTWTAIPSTPPNDAGDIGLSQMGCALAGARDVSEAVRTLNRGAPDVSGCFLIASSRADELAIVEVAGGETSVSRPDESEHIVRGNTFETDRLAEREYTDPNSNPYRATADIRTETGEALLDTGVNVTSLAATLSDHRHREGGLNYGKSICNHGTEFGTVSSEILDPLDGQLYYAYGWPCGERNPSDPLPGTWNCYFVISLKCPVGTYTDVYGNVTPLAIAQLAEDGIEIYDTKS
jgi:hypothetical protein